MAFRHFPPETVKFLSDLIKNNNKNWFEANRSIYENYVLAPAKAFVEEIGPRLKKISPGIIYEPKVDRSIFRLYRDARRYRGKAPFKTHLGIMFWEGGGRLESSCYYLHIEPPFYSAGVGMPMFTPEMLFEFRKTVTEPKGAKELAAILKTAEKEHWQIFGDKLKKEPKGFTPVKGMEDLLLFKSLYLSDETPINEDFYKDDFTDAVFSVFEKMRPYHKWLASIAEKARANELARKEVK